MDFDDNSDDMLLSEKDGQTDNELVDAEIKEDQEKPRSEDNTEYESLEPRVTDSLSPGGAEGVKEAGYRGLCWSASELLEK